MQSNMMFLVFSMLGAAEEFRVFAIGPAVRA